MRNFFCSIISQSVLSNLYVWYEKTKQLVEKYKKGLPATLTQLSIKAGVKLPNNCSLWTTIAFIYTARNTDGNRNRNTRGNARNTHGNTYFCFL